MIFQTESQLKEYGDKLSDDKKKAIEAILKAQSIAGEEEAKIKAMSAESMKAVKAASGASNNKKPTVVGGGGQPKESLVDQLQSYNSIWK